MLVVGLTNEAHRLRDFKPPTAEEAYRLQDDCTRRGELCYVRLDVNSKDLSEWNKHDKECDPE